MCAVLGYRPMGVLLVALLSFNPLLALPKKKDAECREQTKNNSTGDKNT